MFRNKQSYLSVDVEWGRLTTSWLACELVGFAGWDYSDCCMDAAWYKWHCRTISTNLTWNLKTEEEWVEGDLSFVITVEINMATFLQSNSCWNSYVGFIYWTSTYKRTLMNGRIVSMSNSAKELEVLSSGGVYWTEVRCCRSVLFLVLSNFTAPQIILDGITWFNHEGKIIPSILNTMKLIYYLVSWTHSSYWIAEMRRRDWR